MGFLGSIIAGLVRGLLSLFFSWLEKRREGQRIRHEIQNEAERKRLERANVALRYKAEHPADIQGDPFGDFRVKPRVQPHAKRPKPEGL